MNAVEARQEQKSREREYKDRDGTREAAKAGRSHFAEESRTQQEKEEMTEPQKRIDNVPKCDTLGTKQKQEIIETLKALKGIERLLQNLLR